MKCSSSVKRKSLLYKTGVEYGDYTINHVQGCPHGCNYPCYAFLMAKRFGKVKSYEEWISPILVDNSIELLDKELPKLKHKIKSVHMCFTTDPFMYQYSDIKEMSLNIIDKINEYGLKCTVLTKGLLPKELALKSKQNEYGITLISLDEEFRKKMEPGAAPYEERIDALEYLSKEGFKTWVSIEPYPTPNIINQNLDDILERVRFVNKIIFGRLNYNKIVSQYKAKKEYYNMLSEKVIEFGKKNNIEVHIKEGTTTE